MERLSKPREIEINLEGLSLGRHKISSSIEVSKLVTFVRKSDIRYELDYFETFAIVIIDNDYVNIIPFDWFNEKGGDYGYVWPAIAKLEGETLYGQGMRMSNFTIDLREYL